MTGVHLVVRGPSRQVTITQRSLPWKTLGTGASRMTGGSLEKWMAEVDYRPLTDLFPHKAGTVPNAFILVFLFNNFVRIICNYALLKQKLGLVKYRQRLV